MNWNSGTGNQSNVDFDRVSTTSDYVFIDQAAPAPTDDDAESERRRDEFKFRTYSVATDKFSTSSESEPESSDTDSSVIEPVSEDDEIEIVESEESANEEENQEESDEDDGFGFILEDIIEEIENDSENGADDPFEQTQNAGNTSLLTAVRDDAVHLVDELLDDSPVITVFSALMLSLSLGRDQIAKKCINHEKYNQMEEICRRAAAGTLNSEEKASSEDTLDGEEEELDHSLTPIMLASMRNNFEIVVMLLQRGERLEEPHSLECTCEMCEVDMDTILKAKVRLTMYQALSSDSYVILSYDDPIHRAFELRQKLQKLADNETHYKAQYMSLMDQIAHLPGRLLDMVQTGDELDIILNEKYGNDKMPKLARLKLAVRYGEKGFVAHPACQKKLASLWLGSVNPAWVKGVFRSIIFLFVLLITYPFLAIGYWFYSGGKFGRFMESPVIKFAVNTLSYIAFIALVVALSITEEIHGEYTLANSPDIGPHFQYYLNITECSEFDEYMYLPAYEFRVVTMLLVVWLIGLSKEILKKLVTEGSRFFTDNTFNLLNLLQIILYVLSFAFRFYATLSVREVISYFSQRSSWIALANNDTIAVEKQYFLHADRKYWDASDPLVVAEAIFAIGSILTITKMTYVFTVSERLGPLMLSITQMIQDAMSFMVLFFFIITAFCVGFHNVYWYMYKGIPHENGDPEPSQFSSIDDVISLFFWSIFGLGKFDAAGTFNTALENPGISLTGTIMFAVYNWLMVIILINMLIAMMSKSYTTISEKEDLEWKFARTKLFMEYMREGSTLPAPFNILPTLKDIIWLNNKFADDWCYRMAERKPPHVLKAEAVASKDLTDTKSEGYGSRRSSIRSLFRQTPKPADAPSEEYKKLMIQVVKRLVDKTEQDDSEQSGANQLKQDISTLRQEFMIQVMRQGRERGALSDQIRDLKKHIKHSREASTRHHAHIKAVGEKRINEMKDRLKKVEGQFNVMVDALNDTFQVTEDLIIHKFNDFRNDFTQTVDNLTVDVKGVESRVSEYEDRVGGLRENMAVHRKGLVVMRKKLSALQSQVNTVQDTLETEMDFCT